MDVNDSSSALFRRCIDKDFADKVEGRRSSLERCRDRLQRRTSAPSIPRLCPDGRRFSLPDTLGASEELSCIQMTDAEPGQAPLSSNSNLAPQEVRSRAENDPEELLYAIIDEIAADTAASESPAIIIEAEVPADELLYAIIDEIVAETAAAESPAVGSEADVAAEPMSIALRCPPEVLFRIFAGFSVEELCRVGAVCRYWFRVAHDPLLWRRVYIHRQCSVQAALGLLSYAEQPETMHISNNLAINTLVTSSSFLTPALRCLDLGFSDLTPDTLQLLFAASLPRLAHLNLEGCRIVDQAAVRGVVSTCRGLERVTLSHCLNVCDEAVGALCTLSRLTHVNLDGVEWISDEGVARLVSRHGAHLEAVWLDGANLTNATIRRIAQCPRLRLLSIRFCEAVSDLETVAGIATLTSLTLRKASQVSSRDLQQLLSPARSRLSSLSYLDLSECSALTDADVAAMTALCGQRLRHLVLDWCWEVTDLGLIDIVDKCGLLEWLGLAGLHNLSGRPLRSHPEALPHLAVLNLANCNRIQDDVIQALVDDNPALIAFNYYGDRFETDDAVKPDLASEHDLWRIANQEYSRICQC